MILILEGKFYWLLFDGRIMPMSFYVSNKLVISCPFSQSAAFIKREYLSVY
jgi:hypothetical protein